MISLMLKGITSSNLFVGILLMISPLSKKVMEGSIIVVNQKAVTEPFNPTQFANTTLSLLSSLVTIIVLSKQI